MPEGIAVALRPEKGATHILEHVHAREDIGNLKAACQAHSRYLIGWQVLYLVLLEAYVAGSQLITATNKMEQGRFSGAVRSDDRVFLSLDYVLGRHPV